MDASHRDAIGEVGMLPNKIVKLVDKVIDKKRSKVDSLEEEREINEIVYKLYGLTEEEIGIIENGK